MPGEEPRGDDGLGCGIARDVPLREGAPHQTHRRLSAAAGASPRCEAVAQQTPRIPPRVACGYANKLCKDRCASSITGPGMSPNAALLARVLHREGRVCGTAPCTL